MKHIQNFESMVNGIVKGFENLGDLSTSNYRTRKNQRGDLFLDIEKKQDSKSHFTLIPNSTGDRYTMNSTSSPIDAPYRSIGSTWHGDEKLLPEVVVNRLIDSGVLTNREKTERKNGTSNIFNRSNAIRLAKEIKKIVDKYKKYEVENTTVASAPNSSTFRAHVSGEIVPIVNYNHRSNFNSEVYLLGIQVGGGVDDKIKDTIHNEMHKICSDYDNYDGGDGNKTFFKYVSGTNWTMFGITSKLYKYNDGTVDYIINQVFND